MDTTRLRFVLGVGVLVIGTIGAQAQTALPIKAGLWQINTEHEVNGQKMPDMSERMKNMSPEARAQVEAMMKQRGVDPGAGGGLGKVCYSQEMIDRGTWAGQQNDCKVDFTSHSGNSWKWHSSCPKSNYEGDGQATFSNSENYVMKVSSVLKTGGQSRTSNMTLTGKWLSSNCGDVKPLQAKP